MQQVSMQKFLLSTQSDTNIWNEKKGTKKISALHLDRPLIVHTETFLSRRLAKAARLLASLSVTFPVLYVHFQLVKCERLHYFQAPSST